MYNAETAMGQGLNKRPVVNVVVLDGMKMEDLLV
jgi:hypothetical protein